MTRTNARLAMIAAAVGGAIALVPTAQAHESTCSDSPLGIEVHGQHVIRDYVMGPGSSLEWPPAGAVGAAIAGEGAEIPGGPGPGFHFPHGFAPGASFCNDSNSPGTHL
jgi:hypothetical protein